MNKPGLCDPPGCSMLNSSLEAAKGYLTSKNMGLTTSFEYRDCTYRHLRTIIQLLNIGGKSAQVLLCRTKLPSRYWLNLSNMPFKSYGQQKAVTHFIHRWDVGTWLNTSTACFMGNLRYSRATDTAFQNKFKAYITDNSMYCSTRTKYWVGRWQSA